MKFRPLIVMALAVAALTTMLVADAPKRYRVTVWVVRPVVKRTPTSTELQSSRWAIAAPGESQIPIKSDGDLLFLLRRDNPLYNFLRFESKQVVEIPAEKWFTASLPKKHRLRVRVRIRERSRLLAPALPPKGSPDWKQQKSFYAHRLAVEQESHDDHQSLSFDIEKSPVAPGPIESVRERLMGTGRSRPKMEKEVMPGISGSSEATAGMVFMLPGTVWMTSPNIAFVVHHNPDSRRADGRGRVVYQRPTDIVLYRVELL